MRSRLRELHLTPDVVVVSPLTRTLETATGVYGGEPLRDEREDTGHEGILMAPQEEDPGVRTGCPGFSSANAPPFVANELCREGFGRHPCDKRRPVSDAQRRFPGVVEWVVETDEDTWYDEELREPPDNVLRRAREFLAWLQRRPESNLAVVSHAEFLGTLSFVLAHGVSDAAARDALTATFANCEARVVEVRRGGGQGDVPSVT